MADQHILSFSRSDEPGSVVLAQVTPAGSRSQPLNVKIVATESQSIYAVSLKHDRIEKLREKGNKSSPGEWEQILSSVLFDGYHIPDVEAVASISADNLTLTVRKRVQGITSRLGAIVLAATGDEDLELFDWCSAAVAARATVQSELADAVVRTQDLENTVGKLKKQLDELMKTKTDDETHLLEKFRDLLNEKKVKIREQELAIAAARSDSAGNGTTSAVPASATVVKNESSPHPAPIRAPGRGGRGRAPARATAGGRRGAKRKTAAFASDESSDDGFERMDVDQEGGNAAADDSGDQQTTDDDATASEAEDEEPAKATKGPAPDSAPQAPPARRHLPFGQSKKKSPGAPKKPATAPEGSDTESDDEL